MAPRGHPGGPWEQLDGLEVVDNRILLDFEVILGLVYGSFWGSTIKQKFFVSGLFPLHLFTTNFVI